MAHQVEHAASHDLARQSFHLCEAGFHGPGDVIARTPPDRVVELALHQRAPGDIEQRPPVPTPPGRGPPSPGPTRPVRQRRERIRQALEHELRGGVPPLEGRPCAVHALERPGILVRPAQLSRERRRLRPFRRHLEELVEPRDAERALRLERREEIAHPRQLGVRRVVIRSDEHGNVFSGRAVKERAPHGGPGREQPVLLGRERSADLVSGGRQVPEQHVPAVGSAPEVQVALLTRLAAEPAPQHSIPDAELARQRRPHGRVPERVGRVQHVEPAAQPLGVSRPQQQVPHQGLARRDQFVGEHVPRADLEAAGLHERLHISLPLRARTQVVGEQHGLTVEQEAPVAGVRLQSLDQVVQSWNQSRLERSARQVPLAIPVGVRDEMEDDPRHGG